MNADILFENFDLLAEAPNGMQTLRRLILDLGIRGELTNQDGDDEPASELLKRIERTKKRLESEEIVKFEGSIIPVDPAKAPHALPASWLWLNLADVFYTISPSTKKVKSSHVQESGLYPVVDQGQRFIAGYVDDPSSLIHIPGPVVIFGDHTCERKFIDFDFVPGADGTKILRPIECFERYFYLVLKTYEFDDHGYSRHYKFLLDNLFPLAPVDEQRRIVAKVDQLMALCDELEKKQEKRNEARISLNTSALDHLLAAKEPKEFDTHWQRIGTNFDLLYDKPETVGKLRQAILQLAVQGKLSEPRLVGLKDDHDKDAKTQSWKSNNQENHGSDDEPATVLLEKIKAEKERLIKEKKIKKSETLAPITGDEVPYQLPKGWVWCRLGDICAKVQDGTHFSPKGQYPTKRPHTFLYLTSKNVKEYGLDLSTATYIDEVEHRETFGRCNPERGDLLLIKDGAITGRVAINNLDEEFSLLSSVALIKIGHRYVNNEFLLYYLRSPSGQERVIGRMSGSAIKRIILDKIKNTLISLPPLNEQVRIVSKLKTLMKVCDELETNLTHAEKASEELVEAAVRGAVE